jgi:glycerophosphoryl diester phosphodiesterase
MVLLLLILGACARPAVEGWPHCPDPVFDTQGHRGARAHRPENTLPAMLYALQRGVRTLELDISVTRDDVLVLSHDSHLRPDLCLNPDGAPAVQVPIRSLTLRQLQEYDCGSLRHPRFPNQQPVPGTPPPTLKEVFALAEEFSGGTIRYSIEAKIDPAWDPELTPTPERFVELLEQALVTAGITDRTTIQSFDPRILAAIRQRGFPVRTALLVGRERKDVIREKLFGDPVGDAEKAGAVVLSPQWRLVNRSLVAAAHARGIAVIPWTVNDPAVMQRMIAVGVDGLISDDVDLMMRVVREGVCI